MITKSLIVGKATHSTRRVRHNALGLRDRLQCHSRRLRLAFHRIILRMGEVVAGESSHILRLVERHPLIVVIDIAHVEGSEVLSEVDLLQGVIA